MAVNPEINPLGEFLRARREQIQPAGIGLPDTGRRRVRGLRREEVAMQAGVSSDYYIHLEQGRDRHPSDQVIQALARVLMLDDDAIAYLQALAQPREQRQPVDKTERVSAGMLRILEQWSSTAAILQGRFRDVLACTGLTTELHPGLRYDRNTVRVIFLDPAEREIHVDWEKDARESVAWLRGAIGGDVDNPRVNELVGELAVKSEDFGRIWARHDVRRKSSGAQRLTHPEVGILNLGYETFAVNSTPGQSLTIYHPVGPADAEALSRLEAIIDARAEEQGTPSNVVVLEDRRAADPAA
jgi:transcriptional regulator with XRE-family HTH domain